MPRYRPSSPTALVEECIALCDRRDGMVIVAVDGADAAAPEELAESVAVGLRTRGRAADVVVVRDFIRPASVRMEFGHRDAESYRTAWFDYAAIDREVVSAARTDRRWLPRLWDAQTDRSPRERPRPAADDHVILVAGPMLSGRELDFDLVIRLEMSAAALTRRTPQDQQWTVDPLVDHATGTGADTRADLVVRYDHPDRPAIRE